jgi:23S rRNA (uridine2552-2'-O)-methyltransferase
MDNSVILRYALYMNYNPKDHYFKKAKKENYVARSIYKLEEIDQKFKVFKKNDVVLDLGASPGSWSQYALQRVGEFGKVIGVDLSPVSFKNAKYIFCQQDIYQMNWQEILQFNQVSSFNVVLSDMAPKTTGIKLTDQARSLDLCLKALEISKLYLKSEGSFVCKLFHGNDFKILVSELKKIYKQVEALKPDSTRKMSKEIFLIGIGKK